MGTLQLFNRIGPIERKWPKGEIIAKPQLGNVPKPFLVKNLGKNPSKIIKEF